MRTHDAWSIGADREVKRVVLARGLLHSLTTSKSDPTGSIMIPEGSKARRETDQVRKRQPTVASR